MLYLKKSSQLISGRGRSADQDGLQVLQSVKCCLHGSGWLSGGLATPTKQMPSWIRNEQRAMFKKLQFVKVSKSAELGFVQLQESRHL